MIGARPASPLQGDGTAIDGGLRSTSFSSTGVEVHRSPASLTLPRGLSRALPGTASPYSSGYFTAPRPLHTPSTPWAPPVAEVRTQSQQQSSAVPSEPVAFAHAPA